jgi:two-component system LytT family sensor kinase
MGLNDFIYSNKISCRAARHVSFWVCRFVIFYLYMVSIYLFQTPEVRPTATELLTIYPIIVAIFVAIAFVYTTVYFLIPRYLYKRRYWIFSIALIVLCIVLFVVQVLILLILPVNPLPLFIRIWMTMIQFICNGPLTTCGLFIGIKMLKTWYQEAEQSISLTRENANAELQLLKSQIHPHFLFNTLNNIYSFTLSKSPVAGHLVSQLSSILRYMLTDCASSLVTVEKELNLISYYIELERVRYKNCLNVNKTIAGNMKGKLIAPLLLIPFVENCFKHGTSKVLSEPWINLKLILNEHQLQFRLSNSKPKESPLKKETKGIGLENVKKRLRLIYPDAHTLVIDQSEDSYTVDLQVTLIASETLESFTFLETGKVLSVL